MSSRTGYPSYVPFMTLFTDKAVSATYIFTINTGLSVSFSQFFGSTSFNNYENLSPILMISSSNLNTNIISGSKSDSTLSDSSSQSLSISMPSILLFWNQALPILSLRCVHKYHQHLSCILSSLSSLTQCLSQLQHLYSQLILNLQVYRALVIQDMLLS